MEKKTLREEYNYNKNKKEKPIETTYGAKPFISVNPETGERKEVPTAGEDIESREKYAERAGIRPEEVLVPCPGEIPNNK